MEKQINKDLMEVSLQNLAKFNIEIREDEILVDDKLYCSKCNTPRTTTIDVLGNKRTVRCSCQCQKINEMEIKKQVRIAELKKESGISDRYKDASFDTCKTNENESFDIAFNRCKKYCENSDEILKKGYGIYLWGDKGTGKTHLTACMANELTNQCKNVLFTNFFEISRTIRATFKGKGNEIDVINKIANIDFLFIDDLGTEKVTKENEDTWLQEKVYEIINIRYNNMLPTIFTSNYSLQELVQERGLMDKTVDRILGMSTAIIKVEGRSNRSIRVKNDLF